MSWWNPWREVRKLRAEREGLLDRQLQLSNRCGHLELTSSLLLAQRTDLRAQLRQAHIRDPKTGRIQKRGAI